MGADANETFEPDRGEFIGQLIGSVQNYTRDNHIAIGAFGSPMEVRAEVAKFGREQWWLRREELRAAPHHDLTTPQELSNRFRGMIWQCEDHAYTKVMVFCPQQYHEMMENTLWKDQKVFQRVRLSVEEAEEFIRNSLPEHTAVGC